jgi:hypothetical protein
LNIPGILAKYQVLPTFAERALVPISSSSCGIGSITNPHLNDDLGTIIAFPGETFGLDLRRFLIKLAGYVPTPFRFFKGLCLFRIESDTFPDDIRRLRTDQYRNSIRVCIAEAARFF